MLDSLTNFEKEKIYVFNKDEVMVEAVRKVILASVYSNGTLRKDLKTEPLKNAAIGLASMALNGRAVVSNEQLGEDLRAFTQGVFLLEGGFNELTKIIKKEKEPVDKGLKEAI